WRTVGADRYQAFFKGALGALVVYDISRPQTFDSAVKWKEELDANITLPNGSSLPVILLGNKVDLEVANLDTGYIDGFVDTHGFVAWSDVSAKDTSNADFNLSVACLIKKLLCDEELFGPSMRRTAAAFSKGMKERGVVPRGLTLGPGGFRLTLAADTGTKDSSSGSCCG
ncbi:unnamed protein product, partial [Hapterophycus canaliculatus]